jgi:hypothetical protein
MKNFERGTISSYFGIGFVPDCCRTSISENWPTEVDLDSLVTEYPVLFASTLGAAKCTPYEIIVRSTPISLLPFRHVQSKIKIFREMKNDFMQKQIIRPSKSPYVSPAFLVPKNEGGFWMVVDYQKVNSKLFPICTLCR